MATDQGLQALMPPSKRMAEYIHENNFDLVIVGGPSAQTAAIIVKEWWHRLYPSVPLPHFLSLGTKQSEALKLGTLVVDDEVLLALVRSRMAKRKDAKNIFILEEYASTGNTVRRLRSALDQLGFKNVRAGALVLKTGGAAFKELNFVGISNPGFPFAWGVRRRITQKFIEERANRVQPDLERKNLAASRNIRHDLRTAVKQHK